MKARIERRMQECMDRAVADGEVGGVSVLIRQNGREKLYLQSGMRDIEEGLPLERDTVFRCYSMSKVITSAAAMLLLQDGIIDLFEPVSKYLPGFDQQIVAVPEGTVPAVRQVLIRDLLNMTSGMIYPDGCSAAGEAAQKVFDELEGRLLSDSQMTTREFAEKIGRSPLHFQPGERFQYGTNADILGALIESASGMSFGAFLKKRIFDPLGMESAGFSVREEDRSRLTKVYRCSCGKKPVPYYENHLGIRNDGGENLFESGGAGLFMTIDDMAKFTQMLLNEGEWKGHRVMEKGTVRFMTGRTASPEQRPLDQWTGLEGYSYGNLLRVRTSDPVCGYPGEPGEYGWDGWLGTYMANLPASGTSIHIFTQVVDYGTGPMTRKLRNIYLTARD